MRAAQHATAAVAILLLAVAITPGGTHTQWIAGLLLTLASIGLATHTDNHNLKYGITG